VLSFAEKFQARIYQLRAEGKPAGALKLVFVVFCLVGLVVAALLVAGVWALFL
jgi:hypothetical protein